MGEDDLGWSDMKKIFAYSTLFVIILSSTVPVFSPVNGQIADPPVRAVSWSPDGNYIATGSREGILIFDANLNQVAALTEVVFNPQMVWSPDSTRIAFFNSIYDPALAELNVNPTRSFLTIWNVFDNNEAIPLVEVFGAGPVSWSPDGSQLAFGGPLVERFPDGSMSGSAGDAFVANSTTGQIDHDLPIAPFISISRLEWSPDGQYIAGSEASDVILLWDAQTGEVARTLTVPGGAIRLVWNEDSNYIATTTLRGTSIAIVNVDTGDIVNTFAIDTTAIGGRFISLAWKGKVLAAGQVPPSADGSGGVSVWNTQTNQLLASWATSNVVYSVALNPRGTHVAYPGDNSPLRIALIHAVPTDLLEVIAECISDTGIQTSLTARIEAGQWDALINEVKALESTQITTECAAEIIEMAGYFIENPPEESE